MQSLRTALQLVSRGVVATALFAGSTLAAAAEKYRDRRVLEKFSASELADIGLCRAADGAIAFQPRCPEGTERDAAEINTGYSDGFVTIGTEKA
ncbi:DUF1127 domain-containing protein [Mesorhizobium sp. VK23B]|uniref:DUF1127 domain-containing protein n=1 Tax=Mesorhizobium dulcispinae TaxID=3072316 RepID=A0ABU4X6T4_9HYPH|nr:MULTISPECIES: DUF1127 domain-containing protein [unclassified Mesorhizobium]MDX8464134.1 DUF1127 domain-containing protein [Mesorhizobium sp. VK23B]MDX8470520.1 DUF1127 domain-containing protein [Mesorhizobium sp. VK23A]